MDNINDDTKQLLTDIGLCGRMVDKGEIDLGGGVKGKLYMSPDEDWERYAIRILAEAKQPTTKVNDPPTKAKR